VRYNNDDSSHGDLIVSADVETTMSRDTRTTARAAVGTRSTARSTVHAGALTVAAVRVGR
jgi:hypothetical protein